jgi:hypothetical protein
VYGISKEDQARLLEKQKGRCAACRDKLKPGRGTHLDHDHVTRQVRGFLCTHCNLAEGHMKGSPSKLRALAEYIERHAQLRLSL